MIKVQIESNGIESVLTELADQMGLTINKEDQQNFDSVVWWTIAGNAATISMLLIKIYEKVGNRVFVNYKSEKIEQDELSLSSAIDIAVEEKENSETNEGTD